MVDLVSSSSPFSRSVFHGRQSATRTFPPMCVYLFPGSVGCAQPCYCFGLLCGGLLGDGVVGFCNIMRFFCVVFQVGWRFNIILYP